MITCIKCRSKKDRTEFEDSPGTRRGHRPTCMTCCNSSRKGQAQSLEQAFWRNVDHHGPDECWPWLGSKNDQGYGDFKFQKVRYSATRYAYERVHGPLPDGMGACHTCDNPSCCNAAHLFPGTQKDNMQDAKRKGRTKNAGLTGDAHPTRKVTSEDVRVIRALRGIVTGVELAKRFGLTPTGIAHIQLRQTWKQAP